MKKGIPKGVKVTNRRVIIGVGQFGVLISDQYTSERNKYSTMIHSYESREYITHTHTHME